MSKVLFGAVKELIIEKKYAEARAILKTIDDPKAREWEAKLDQIDPAFSPPVLPASRPPQMSTLGRGFDVDDDDLEEKNKHLNMLIVYVGAALFLVLAVYMLGTLSPAPKVDTHPQATVSALFHHATESALERTQIAVAAYDTEIAVAAYATELAKPTATSIPPTPTFGETQAVYVTQTMLAFEKTVSYIVTATYMMDSTQQMIDQRLEATRLNFTSTPTPTRTPIVRPSDTPGPSRTPHPTRAVTLTPTRVVSPTMVFTPMSPTFYYALDTYWLLLCPFDTCANTREVFRGTEVNVIGIVDGSFSAGGTNKWYKIRLSDGARTFYAYQLVELFSPTPPDINSVPIPTTGPSPSPRPTATRQS